MANLWTNGFVTINDFMENRWFIQNRVSWGEFIYQKSGTASEPLGMSDSQSSFMRRLEPRKDSSVNQAAEGGPPEDPSSLSWG